MKNIVPQSGIAVSRTMSTLNTALHRSKIAALIAIISNFTANYGYTLDAPRGTEVITVRVEAKPEPVRAVGVVFTSSSSHQVDETEITKIGDKLYEISFAVPRTLLRQDSVASAMAFDESGTLSFANVTPALADEARELIASIPECAGENPASVAALNGPGILQQLVDVRTERMNIVRLRLARLMDQDFLAKLRKFEEAFGLSRPVELTPDLPAEELIDRLSRIQHAVRKYQMHQK